MSKTRQGAPAPEAAAFAIPLQASEAPTTQTTTGPIPGAVNYPNVTNTPNLPDLGVVTHGYITGIAPGDTVSYPHGQTATIPLDQSGWQTVVPGTPGTPHQPWPWQVPPIGNGIVGSYIYTTPPQYWGVQEKSDAIKSGPQYWVINPDTLNSLLYGSPKIVARTETENDAQLICQLLNEWHAKTHKCSCGPSDQCSNCPVPDPRAKEVPATMTSSHVKDTLQSLQGRVLTVIDAAIPGEQQNKALKSLFKREFRKSITEAVEFCHRHLNWEPDYGETDEQRVED